MSRFGRVTIIENGEARVLDTVLSLDVEFRREVIENEYLGEQIEYPEAVRDGLGNVVMRMVGKPADDAGWRAFMERISTRARIDGERRLLAHACRGGFIGQIAVVDGKVKLARVFKVTLRRSHGRWYLRTHEAMKHSRGGFQAATRFSGLVRYRFKAKALAALHLLLSRSMCCAMTRPTRRSARSRSAAVYGLGLRGLTLLRADARRRAIAAASIASIFSSSGCALAPERNARPIASPRCTGTALPI